MSLPAGDSVCGVTIGEGAAPDLELSLAPSGYVLTRGGPRRRRVCPQTIRSLPLKTRTGGFSIPSLPWSRDSLCCFAWVYAKLEYTKWTIFAKIKVFLHFIHLSRLDFGLFYCIIIVVVTCEFL